MDEPETLDAADVVIIGAPFDGGTSYRAGARMGPRAIRQVDYLPPDAFRPHVEVKLDPLEVLGVRDAGDLQLPNGDIEATIRIVEEAVAVIMRSGAISVTLGGDHTVALPDITAVARHHGWGEITVVHFDAHADTGDEIYGQRYSHGTPMRRVIESGACRGENFIQIGLRGYWPEPETFAWMHDRGMNSYTMSDIADRGLDAILDDTVDHAKQTAGIFLSVDIDVVDPGFAPGTGTPEPGGLTSRDLLLAVRKLCSRVPVLGLDIVEVAPAYDHADVTALLANRVVLESLSGIALRTATDQHATEDAR